jgi:hypothetical protein
VNFPGEYTLLLEWLGLFSVLTFIGSLIAIPWIIGRLPEKFFIRHRQVVEERHKSHPVVAKLTLVLRNAVGFFFLVAGLAMLVLPGQGIIMMLIGITLIDFPRKHQVIDFLVRRPRVVKLLNWIRDKEKKPPFEF